MAVGRALTMWEHAEVMMALTFYGLMHSPKEPRTIFEPAARAYSAVITFNGRMEMMQAAADAYFISYAGQVNCDEYTQRSLNHLIKLARKAGTRRNELAHAMTRKIDGLDGIYLGPPISSNKVDYYWKPAYLYTAKQISEYADRFTKLEDCFNWFYFHQLRPSLDEPQPPRPAWIPAP